MDGIEKLKKDLRDIPDDSIVLLEVTPEKAFELGLASVKLLADRKASGIIVSANRPYSNLLSVYTKNGIDVSKMFFLDCISKNQNAEIKADNVVFIENASSLTDISLSINERIKNMNGKRFVFFDSISTLLIHNNPTIFARFLHGVLTKMRLTGSGGIIVSLNGHTNKEIRAEIAQLCDKVISIT
jgi:hypothetical protein